MNLETNIETLETVLFTDISVKEIGRSKPSDILPILHLISKNWGLNKHSQGKIIKRILINSVKYN